jgi:hypothetical protein
MAMSDPTSPPPTPEAKPVMQVLEYATPTPPPGQTVEWRQIWPMLMFVLAALALLGSIVPLDSDELIAMLFVFLWLPTALGAIIRLLRSRRGAELSKAKRTVCVITCWMSVATLVLSARYDQCPHAHYYGFGPFSIAKGQRCANARRYDNLLTYLFRHN